MFLHHRRYQFSSGYFFLQEESHAVFARSDTSKLSLLPYLEQVEKVRIPNFQEFSVFLQIVLTSRAAARS